MNLESLIHAKLDGEITPEQHAQLEALLRDGSVQRGWLGVEPQNLNPEIVEAEGVDLHQPAQRHRVDQAGFDQALIASFSWR